MRFTRIMATVAAVLAAHAAAAEAPAEQTFTRDGNTYAYTRSLDENGTTVIEGRDVANGRPFRLTVADGRVRGTVDGQRVSFRAPDAN